MRKEIPFKSYIVYLLPLLFLEWGTLLPPTPRAWPAAAWAAAAAAAAATAALLAAACAA